MQDDISIRQVEACLFPLLSEAGFVVSGQTASYEITPATLGWIGINIARHRGFLRLNPNVGIHSIEIERCLASINGRKYQKGRIATVSFPLGKFAPDEDKIVIDHPSNIFPECKSLVNILVNSKSDIGEIAKADNLEAALQKRVAQLGGFPERYALFLLLGQRRDEFEIFISSHRVEVQRLEQDELLNGWDKFCIESISCLGR